MGGGSAEHERGGADRCDRAMACGKPVVATDVGGVSEILGDAGILVSPRNPRTLARGILKVLSDEELARELGLRARMRVLKKFPIWKIVKEYREIYRELIRRHGVEGEIGRDLGARSCLKPHSGSDLSLYQS